MRRGANLADCSEFHEGLAGRQTQVQAQYSSARRSFQKKEGSEEEMGAPMDTVMFVLGLVLGFAIGWPGARGSGLLVLQKLELLGMPFQKSQIRPGNLRRNLNR
jgi:hypothetical protein